MFSQIVGQYSFTIQREINNETIVNNCDKWIVFGDTLARGKKNDHVFHNAVLSYLIKFYNMEREAQGKQPIPNNIIHTDNCPTQYKCRQNFYHIATCGQKFPCRIVHKFAQKFGFKGPWDATGKIVKQAIKNCELQFKRCANAIDCYDNIRERLAQDGSGKRQNQWKKWELEKNEEILTKRVFRTNRTFIGLAAETKEEYDELVASGREHVVFTNREHVPDMKAIPGTQKIYQATGICVGEKTLTTAELQCSCGPCRSNPGNTETCLYKDQRGEI